MVAFYFGRQAMKWSFLAQAEDHGRMQARVLQILDRQMASVECFSMAKLDGSIFLSFVVEANEGQATRAEAQLRKLQGVDSVAMMEETATVRRMIAQFRVHCDISDRAELLHFIQALDARALMIRPLWVAFEAVGTPCEVEGIYQSALGYGLVDLVSSSCSLMVSRYESKRSQAATCMDEVTVEQE
jgi:acetolactate synthase small subunit